MTAPLTDAQIREWLDTPQAHISLGAMRAPILALLDERLLDILGNGHPGEQAVALEHNAAVQTSAVTPASRSCPASANLAWPRERITSTTSPATARLEYPAWSVVCAGPTDRPYPLRSVQTTVKPRRTRSGATRCQVADVRGWPCSSTTGGPSPP